MLFMAMFLLFFCFANIRKPVTKGVLDDWFSDSEVSLGCSSQGSFLRQERHKADCSQVTNLLIALNKRSFCARPLKWAHPHALSKVMQWWELFGNLLLVSGFDHSS
jgi:hypothetical protein